LVCALPKQLLASVYARHVFAPAQLNQVLWPSSHTVRFHLQKFQILNLKRLASRCEIEFRKYRFSQRKNYQRLYAFWSADSENPQIDTRI